MLSLMLVVDPDLSYGISMSDEGLRDTGALCDAIAWALAIAEEEGDTLVAAFLAQAYVAARCGAIAPPPQT